MNLPRPSRPRTSSSKEEERPGDYMDKDTRRIVAISSAVALIAETIVSVFRHFHP